MRASLRRCITQPWRQALNSQKLKGPMKHLKDHQLHKVCSNLTCGRVRPSFTTTGTRSRKGSRRRVSAIVSSWHQCQQLLPRKSWVTTNALSHTLAGEFVVVNKHLVNDLKKVGLWSKEMKDLMVKAGGSIQNIVDIPDDIKQLYKTVWEISQKCIIDMAADRGRFIDQSQSMNLFMESPTLSKLSSMHMYAWKAGLKTGMYYLRSKAKARPIQFSLEPECVACSA